MTHSDTPGPQITSPQGACRFLKNAKDADRESFYSIYLDTRGRVTGVEEVHKGTANHVGVHPREIFKGALATNATSVILAHNHPSGNPDPSRDDAELTKRLVGAGELLGIPVLDHVIVGREGCYSFSEQPAFMNLFSGPAPYRQRKKRR